MIKFAVKLTLLSNPINPPKYISNEKYRLLFQILNLLLFPVTINHLVVKIIVRLVIMNIYVDFGIIIYPL